MDDDGEVRELTETHLAAMRPFAELTQEEQAFLLRSSDAALRTESLPLEEVRLKLSAPVLERFRASGTGWEQRVDAALREWIAEHQAS